MARATKPPVRPDAWASAVSTTPDIEESVYVDTGFPAPAGVPVVPTRGEFNYEMNRYDTGLQYLVQRGITDWDTDETDYDTGDIVRDTDGVFYMLVGTATPATAPSADQGNWYACLRPPHALLAETEAYLTGLPWRNAVGFPIAGRDHRGFDAGRIMDFRENWTDGGAATRTVTAAAAHWFGPWQTGIDNSGGTAGFGCSLPGPYATDLTTHPRGPMLAVNAFGASVSAVSIVETSRPIIKMTQGSLVFECAFSINGASGPQTSSAFALGLGDGTLAANRMLSQPGPAVAHGAWIVGQTNSSPNWTAQSKPNGGAIAGTDTGIAIAKDVEYLYRCVIVGTSDSDDGTARVIHLLNGVVVANQTTSLTNQVLSPFVHTLASAGEVCSLFVGPMRVQARLVFGAQSVL